MNILKGGIGMRIEIPAEVEHIIQTLQDHGYEAYAVGGCVRDTLMGRVPEDWDLTTSANPLEVKALFPRTIDTGIQHGTVTIMIGKQGFEVTTYRIDGEYEDGRHPKEVLFTSDLVEDLRRRDFTINAMAYSHETGIVDKFDGVADLKHSQIRCVGNAMDRFSEDALRILRAIRFRAQLDFEIEEETKKAISIIAPNIAKVSKERIQMELTKLLKSDFPERIVEIYEAGISTYIGTSFATIPVERVTIPITLSTEKFVRWAAFLRNTDATHAVRVLKDLKLDNDTIRKVKTLVAWSGCVVDETAVSVRKAMSQMEPEVWDTLMELNQYGSNMRAITEDIREKKQCLHIKELAINGQDLIASGMKPGKEIGEMLERCLELVLENPEQNKKEILLAQIHS